MLAAKRPTRGQFKALLAAEAKSIACLADFKDDVAIAEVERRRLEHQKQRAELEVDEQNKDLSSKSFAVL